MCFWKFLQVSINEFDIIFLYTLSLPGFKMQCGLKYTGKNFQTLQYKELFLLLVKNTRGGISSVLCDRCVKGDQNKKILDTDAIFLDGHALSQSPLYNEIKFDKDEKFAENLNTPCDSDPSYFFEVDLNYPDSKKERTIFFSFCPQNKFGPHDEMSDYMREMTPNVFTKK